MAKLPWYRGAARGHQEECPGRVVHGKGRSWGGMSTGGDAEAGVPMGKAEGTFLGRNDPGKGCLWERMSQEWMSPGRDDLGRDLCEKRCPQEAMSVGKDDHETLPSQGGRCISPSLTVPCPKGGVTQPGSTDTQRIPLSPYSRARHLVSMFRAAWEGDNHHHHQCHGWWGGEFPRRSPPSYSPCSWQRYLAAAVAEVLPLLPGLCRLDGAQGAGDVDDGRSAAAQPILPFGLGRLLQQGQECLQRDGRSAITILFLFPPSSWGGGACGLTWLVCSGPMVLVV